MAKRIKIGDIIEIETSIGFAYAQYTHKHNKYGALIRVFDKVFKESIDDFDGVEDIPVRFSIFFPLQAAINRDIFKVVGNRPVAEKNQQFPVFRDGTPHPKTRQVEVWWLWDGEKEWRVGELTESQWKLPIRGIWNDTLLIERIESGWRQENSSW
jgi:hypothetical protein